jgi:hypothetical protein
MVPAAFPLTLALSRQGRGNTIVAFTGLEDKRIFFFGKRLNAR